MHFFFTAPVYHTNQHYAVKGLLEAGHEVSFVALWRQQSEVHEALKPSVLGESSAMRAIGVRVPPLSDFWCLMRGLKPDVVVVRNPHSAYGFLSVAVARLMGRTVVFYTQTPMYRHLGWKKRVMRAFPAWATRAKWITPVLGSPERYPSAFGALRYVPFVMEPQTTPREKLWFRDDTINVLSIGKFQVRKNHRLFLQAVADLSERYPIRATVIGESATEDRRREFVNIEEYAQSLGLGDRVQLRTNMSYRDVQHEYSRHDLFVLPSRDEPAAVSPLEAMSHSLPVICSDTNGTQRYIRSGENGYVFRTDDLDHLEKCMERIISDRERLIEMGARSYELVVSEHSPAKYVESLVSIAEGHG